MKCSKNERRRPPCKQRVGGIPGGPETNKIRERGLRGRGTAEEGSIRRVETFPFGNQKNTAKRQAFSETKGTQKKGVGGNKRRGMSQTKDPARRDEVTAKREGKRNVSDPRKQIGGKIEGKTSE